jgi:hypothetical protein
MKINEVFYLLKDFSEENALEFKKFINSPFFHNNKAAHKLFDEIMNYKNLLLNSEFEKIIKNIKKKFKHSHSTIIQRLSILYRIVLKFFKIKSFLGDEVLSEISLNEYLLKNRKYKSLELNLKKISSKINNKKNITEKHFWNSFNYNVQKCDLFTYKVSFINNKNANEILHNLSDASIDLFLYSLVQQINIFASNYFLNVETGNYGKFYFPFDIKKILEEFDKNNLSNLLSSKKSIYELYKLMYLALYNREDSEYFLQYKKCFYRIINSLSKELIKFHYDLIINYCVMKERLGEEKDFYKRQQAELLLEYIEKGYFKTKENEHLLPAEYRNFILIAFSINDIKLLKYFIDNCTIKLNYKDYFEMMNYGLVYYYYSIKDYDKVLESINNIKDNAFIYRFDIRNMSLRVYYETNEINKLLDLIHNYKRSILDETIFNKSNKISFLKLLKYLNKLVIIKNNPNKNLRKESEYLYDLIDKEPIFTLKKWLLEKLNEHIKQTNKQVTII